MSENEEKKLIEIPYAYPTPLFEWFQNDIDNLTYRGDKENINNRMAHKIASLWMIWHNIRNDEKLRDIILGFPDKYAEDSNDYYIRLIVMSLIDRLAKVLSITDIMEELRITRYKNNID